jgi:hypothetical protein
MGMFRMLGWGIRLLIKVRLLTMAFGLGLLSAYALGLRRAAQSWGLVAGAEGRTFPGDDLVSDADAVETRSLEIHAPPEQVWLLLMRLGYGRGGWYSARLLDWAWSPVERDWWAGPEPEADVPAELSVGDLVPTGPTLGLEVRAVDAAAALVLYLDDASARTQLQAAIADGRMPAAGAGVDPDMPPYAVSWAFVLEAAPGDGTRLIERVRVRFDDLSGGQRRLLPVLQLGLFALLRSQLEGIKARSEQAAG